MFRCMHVGNFKVFHVILKKIHSPSFNSLKECSYIWVSSGMNITILWLGPRSRTRQDVHHLYLSVVYLIWKWMSWINILICEFQILFFKLWIKRFNLWHTFSSFKVSWYTLLLSILLYNHSTLIFFNW